MSSQIADMIRACRKCQRHRPERSEPLMPLEFPERPWERIVTYLFHWHNSEHLILSFTPTLQPVATICSFNSTTAASTPGSTPSSLTLSTCGTNCHQTQWGLHRSICSRTDSPPLRCIKPYILLDHVLSAPHPAMFLPIFTNVLHFYMNVISSTPLLGTCLESGPLT